MLGLLDASTPSSRVDISNSISNKVQFFNCVEIEVHFVGNLVLPEYPIPRVTRDVIRGGAYRQAIRDVEHSIRNSLRRERDGLV